MKTILALQKLTQTVITWDRYVAVLSHVVVSTPIARAVAVQAAGRGILTVTPGGTVSTKVTYSTHYG